MSHLHFGKSCSNCLVGSKRSFIAIKISKSLDFTDIGGNVPSMKLFACYSVLYGAPRIVREKLREEIKRKRQRKLLDVMKVTISIMNEGQ